MQLKQTYSAFGRNPVRDEISFRPIFFFNAIAEASKEPSHAANDLQERNRNPPSIAKSL